LQASGLLYLEQLAKTLITTLIYASAIFISREELGKLKLTAPEWKGSEPQSKPPDFVKKNLTSSFEVYLKPQSSNEKLPETPKVKQTIPDMEARVGKINIKANYFEEHDEQDLKHGRK
jgi:hypothetical protein